jgi:acetyl esterase/lipase
MISMLDLRAYCLKIVFNSLGRLGSPLLNFGLAKGLDLLADVPYGPLPDQRLDIWKPGSSEPSPLPILVFFHGGGWVSADKRIYKGIAATFARSGFVFFNVNYRLAPKYRFSAPLQDAVLAIDWIHRNAERYGGDPTVIVLAGDSAGAQIASWYASALYKDGLLQRIGVRSHVSETSVKGLLLFYGVYDFDTVQEAPFPFIRIYARSFLGAEMPIYRENSIVASPIRQISPDLPPIWLCAGERDGLFSQSKAYAQALENHGVRCRSLFFSGKRRAGHGFLFFRWLGASKEAVASALDFLRDTTALDSKTARGSDSGASPPS